MSELEAIYNAGRWMVYCPRHGKDGAVLALNYHKDDPAQSAYWTEGNEYICPVCYPGSVATLQVLKGRQIVKIADRSSRATARLLARAKGEIYTVTFPEHKDEIEKVLSVRPKMKQNWDGRHETLQFLEQENHIMENFAGRDTGIDVIRKVY